MLPGTYQQHRGAKRVRLGGEIDRNEPVELSLRRVFGRRVARSVEAVLTAPAGDSIQREVVRLLTSAAQGDGAPLRSGHERIARQAMAYLREHGARTVYAADLCLATGISDRWLREAFWRVYGTTLTRLLRLRRLNQARRELMSTPTSVTEVANAHGFFDLGRFAGSYRDLFGESPSATARRYRPPA
jgi:AraC-like DNA-binding protein